MQVGMGMQCEGLARTAADLLSRARWLQQRTVVESQTFCKVLGCHTCKKMLPPTH